MYASVTHKPSSLQSREAKLRNPEDVAKYGSLLLQHYQSSLPEDECECGLWMAACGLGARSCSTVYTGPLLPCSTSSSVQVPSVDARVSRTLVRLVPSNYHVPPSACSVCFPCHPPPHTHTHTQQAVWQLHEQVAVALLECGNPAAAVTLIKAVLVKFPESIRARRLQVGGVMGYQQQIADEAAESGSRSSAQHSNTRRPCVALVPSPTANSRLDTARPSRSAALLLCYPFPPFFHSGFIL